MALTLTQTATGKKWSSGRKEENGQGVSPALPSSGQTAAQAGATGARTWSSGRLTLTVPGQAAPASSTPTYGDAQNTVATTANAQAKPTPTGAATSAVTGARIIADAAGPTLAWRQNEIKLESLRKRAEELEEQYRRLSQDASRSRYRRYGSERAEAGELWRAAREAYEQAAAEMGLAKPTFGERISKTLSGAGKQYLGSVWDAAGAVMPNGTAVVETYQEQLESLYGERQRTEEWLKEFGDEQERRQNDIELEALRKRAEELEAQYRHIPQTASEGAAFVVDAAQDAEVRELWRAALEEYEQAKPEDYAEWKLLENRLASINEQIAVYEASVRANDGVSDAARDAAAEITQSGAADLERAKFGATKAGQLLVDAGAAGAQMAGDAALGAMTGFGSMAPMMVRSFGGGTQQAREKGYSQKQQIAMGLSSAATEYFSEKLFGGNPVYDADAGLVSKLVGKITSNETVLEYLASKPAEMLYEGLEEVTADLLEPLAEQIIAGQHDELTLEQVIEDGLVGIIVAGWAQGGVKIANTAAQKIGDAQLRRAVMAMENGQGAESAVVGMENAAPVNNGAASKYTQQEADSIRHEGKTFRNIIAGVDTTVSDFFGRWKEGRKSHQGEKLEKLYLARLSEDSAEKVSKILGYEVSERDVIVTNDDVKHIVDQHPEMEQWVFEALPEIVSAPSNISKGHQGTGKNSAKTGVIFEKMLPDGNVVAIQFDNPGRGTMQVTTVYVTEKAKIPPWRRLPTYRPTPVRPKRPSPYFSLTPTYHKAGRMSRAPWRALQAARAARRATG